MTYKPGVISVGAIGSIIGNACRTRDLTKGEGAATGIEADQKHARGWDSLFPGVDRRLITLPVNFDMPFLREMILSSGLVTSAKETFRNILKKGPGNACVVVVGGAKEATFAEEGEITLILEGRKGFVREAIMGGASLVPILSFGENDIYHMVHPEENSTTKKVQDWILKNTGVSAPLFRGRSIFFKSFGLMPERKAINVVVGTPIDPPLLTAKQIADFRPKFDKQTRAPMNEDAKMVEEMHRKYVDGIKALYQTHKNATWNRPGFARKGTMHVN